MQDKDDYRVSVYSSKLGLPLQFAVHTYLVTEHAGIKNRYEVFAPFTLPKESSPYKNLIYKNLLQTETGFLLWYRKKQWWRDDAPGLRWKVQRHSTVHGGSDSAAHALFNFVEEGGLENYPYHSCYRLVYGPNSNTFTQWVVDQVPNCNLKLPWNAWGKGYRRESH